MCITTIRTFAVDFIQLGSWVQRLLQLYKFLYVGTIMHAKNHISVNKRPIYKVTHCACTMHFGQYQASSAALNGGGIWAIVTSDSCLFLPLSASSYANSFLYTNFIVSCPPVWQLKELFLGICQILWRYLNGLISCTGGHMTSMDTIGSANEEIINIHTESIHAVYCCCVRELLKRETHSNSICKLATHREPEGMNPDRLIAWNT